MGECVGILHNLLFLLGNLMPQDAQGPALDCLDVLTNEPKAQKELMEVIKSGERPIEASLQQVVEDMCQKELQAAAPTPEAKASKESTYAVDSLTYRAPG